MKPGAFQLWVGGSQCVQPHLGPLIFRGTTRAAEDFQNSTAAAGVGPVATPVSVSSSTSTSTCRKLGRGEEVVEEDAILACSSDGEVGRSSPGKCEDTLRPTTAREGDEGDDEDDVPRPPPPPPPPPPAPQDTLCPAEGDEEVPEEVPPAPPRPPAPPLSAPPPATFLGDAVLSNAGDVPRRSGTS